MKRKKVNNLFRKENSTTELQTVKSTSLLALKYILIFIFGFVLGELAANFPKRNANSESLNKRSSDLSSPSVKREVVKCSTTG